MNENTEQQPKQPASVKRSFFFYEESNTENLPSSKTSKPFLTETEASSFNGTMAFFNNNIHNRFEKAKTPILAFLDKIPLLEKRYQTLLKTLGHNYDKYSYTPPTYQNRENHNPKLFPHDDSMDTFYNELDILIENIATTIDNYIPSLKVSHHALKKIAQALRKKLVGLPESSPYYEPFSHMEKNCSMLVQSIKSQFDLLKTVYKQSCTVKEILGSNENNEEEMEDAVLKDYIMAGLIKHCNKTPNQAFIFLSQEKIKPFFRTLDCFYKEDFNASLYIIDGLIENIQYQQKASSALRCLR